MISFRLFGGASLEAGGGVLTGPAAQRHRLAVLALLASAHPRGLARDRLTAYLWPDRDDAHSRNLLNQAVHALRRALGEDAIVSAGEELRLNAEPLRCDLIEFEALLAAGDLVHATELYAGPLLDGFFLPDAPEFEQWADGERERVRRAFCRALETLAQDAGVRHEPVEAAAWWRRLAAQEPYNAHVTLRLMEALDAAGDRAGAIQQARLHSLLIKQEFDAEPDPQVVVAERLRTENHGYPIPVPDRADAAPVPASDARPSRAEHSPTDWLAERVTANDRPAAVGIGRFRMPIAATTLVAVIVAVMVWFSVNAAGSRPSEIRRIAVLPLANLTGDPQQDHFVAAMHDALVAELAQIQALTVHSRQSVLRYQGSDMTLPQIARELRADALVEGSVFRSGDSVRITVQLVRAEPEGHVWAGTHQGPLGRALGLQGEVARSIADAIRARVAPIVWAQVGSDRVVEPNAQQAYIMGLYHLERASYGPFMPASERDAELRNAIVRLEEAVALDPDWPRAHAKLALAYHWLASGSRENEAEFYPKSRQAARRALELDDTESQAWASLGFVLYAYDWDWAGAERAFRRALERDPNSHHSTYAQFLRDAGRLDEAIVHMHRAAERNPLSDILQIQIANTYACAGRYDEAIAAADRLRARSEAVGPGHPAGAIARAGPLDLKALIYSMKGAHAEAIAAAEQVVADMDSLAGAVANLAFVYARAGRMHEARALAGRLEERSGPAVNGRRLPAHLLAALGERDEAIDVVETAILSRGRLPNFRCHLAYRLLRDEPRMRELLKPVRFPH